MNAAEKSALPLVIARDVYVDDVTSGLPVLRIELSDLGHGQDIAVRLAPDACRHLAAALGAAA